ncbi:MAG: STAS domain-containing protein [Alphaproteobacteria bacterium]|jgi:anti-anti-sigma factor|nr:STAS domain-containing protein [Alphaproteobacteria bacterium]
MDISDTQVNGIQVLDVAGRIDSGTAKSLEDKVVGFLDGGTKALVIDLSKVEFVSSAGLRVFLLAAKRLKAVGGKYGLAGLQPSVREVFEVSGFSKIFSLFADRAEALDRLG